MSLTKSVALESYIKCLLPLRHSKGKAIPIQACTGLESFSKLRLQDFVIVGIWRWEVCQPYSPTPQEIFLVLISVTLWVDLTARVRPKGLRQWRIPVTPTEKKSATFPVITQCCKPTAPRCAPFFTPYKTESRGEFITIILPFFRMSLKLGFYGKALREHLRTRCSGLYLDP